MSSTIVNEGMLLRPEDTDGLSLLLRPSVAELRRRYEEMVAKLNSGSLVWTKRPRRNSTRLSRGPIIFQPVQENGLVQTSVVLNEEPQSDTPEPSKADLSSASLIATKVNDSIEASTAIPSQEILTPTTPQLDAIVSTITNLTELLAMFENPCESSKCIYYIDLSNNSIGNEILLDTTATIRELVESMHTKVEVPSIDLSWNDLEEESLTPFVQVVLSSFFGVESIKLDGNPIAAPGVEAILMALTESRAYSHEISLSFKETSIGDDGASHLGTFLKDNQLPLTLLDLTNSCIFDATVALALDLHNNITLHTLILDDNMIGNQGAFALGEALIANTHLNRLQLRNCDIGAAGITTLCAGMKVHPSLQILDVSLNPWELIGELQLLELTWALPATRLVKWREGGWDYGEEGLSSLVQHFSSETVLDRILKEASDAFYPLITNTQLLQCELLAAAGPMCIASQLVQREKHLCSTDTTGYVDFVLAALEVLTELAAIHLNSLHWVEAIGLICPLFTSWLSPVFQMHPVGLIQLKLVQLLSVIVQFGDSAVNNSILHCIRKCIDLFFAFPNRNLYHQQFVELVDNAFKTKEGGESAKGKLQEWLRVDLAPRIKSLIEENGPKKVGYRSCLYGNAFRLALIIGPHVGTPGWVAFEKKYIVPQQEIVSTPLGGPPPQPLTSPNRRPVMEL